MKTFVQGNRIIDEKSTFYTLHHSDKTTEIIEIPVSIDPDAGEELLTETAVFKIDFYKAKYELNLLKKRVEKLENKNGELQELVDKAYGAI